MRHGLTEKLFPEGSGVGTARYFWQQLEAIS